ncbi:hypothetical protein [Cellulomonas citrea]|uniref:hypothetical protein n=1 Tax=Cellulomonas citrea TaxID=1909423 RepID=UPI0013583B8E|nr:hypothetical protein [Cellulomonas citrea]
MLRRLMHAALPLAVAALVVAGTAPAAAAFDGSASVSAPSTATVGTNVRITIDNSGLVPAPTSYTVLWQSQPVGGGTITDLAATGPAMPDPSGITDVTFTGTTTVGTYLLAQVTLTNGANTYVAGSQTVIQAGTFSTAPSALAVSGTARVGQTLSVTTTASAWTPAPGAITYAWHDVADNSVIGTGSSYTLTAADLGRTLYVQAAATKDGYTTSEVASSFIGAVGAGSFTLVSAPAVTGGLRVDESFTATAPSFTPTPSSITYQWRHTSGGAAVPGATSLSLTPTADLVGESLYLEATATLDGYQSYVTASNTSGAVAQAALTPVTALAVPSGATFGVPVTLTVPTFTPAAQSVTYQWYRTPDVAIDGATGTSYTPTVDDVGSQLYVVATATATGAQGYESASNLTGAVALASFTTAPVPAISGLGLVGAAYTVDAEAGSWAPAPTSITYRWFRATPDQPVGTLLVGVTGTTYTPTESEIGSYFYVEATAHRTGYADYVIGSRPSQSVGQRWVQTDTADGTVTTSVRGQLHVTLHGLSPLTTYQLEIHSTPISLGSFTTDASGSAVIDLPLPDGVGAGHHTLVVLQNGTQVLSAPVTVTAATLASTGAEPGVLLALATSLLALGALALQVARRRTSARPQAVRTR